MDKIDGDKIYTLQEFGDLFRISKSTVYRLIDQGKIGFFRIGKKNGIRISHNRHVVPYLIENEAKEGPKPKVLTFAKIPKRFIRN